MRAPTWIALILALGLGSARAAPSSPGDSLVILLTEPGKQDELDSWLQQATLEQLCDRITESFRALTPGPRDSQDQEFAWEQLMSTLARAMQQRPHALSDPETALGMLGERLLRKPADPAALGLFVGCLRRIEQIDAHHPTFETIAKALPFIVGTFREPASNIPEDLFRMQMMEEALSLLHRGGSGFPEIEVEWTRAIEAMFLESGRAPEVRGNALGILERRGTASIADQVRRILTATEAPEDSPLRSRAVRVLGRLEGAASLPLLHQIASQTQDESTFAAVGHAAAKIGGLEALRVLLDSNARFGGNLFGMYISRADTLILHALQSRELDECALALRGIDHVRKPDHPAAPNPWRNYRSLLLSFATDEFHRPLRRQILQALAQHITAEEAAALLEKLTRDSEIAPEWDLLRHVRDRAQIPSTPSEVSPPEQRVRGNHEGQEYGDPGYRKLGFFGEWPLLEEFGHTGIYAGLSPGPNGQSIGRIIEVGTIFGDHVVQTNEWEPMDCPEPNCWGTFTLNDVELSFEERRAIVDTSRDLIEQTISYPLSLPPDVSDAMNAVPGGAPYVDPWEIERLRCDGLIEYCYELHGFPVWGPWGADCNISRYEWIDAHNDLYVPHAGNPNVELAPVVQCGRAGGVSTHMETPSRLAAPTYITAYNVETLAPNLHRATVVFTATDESGIHFIAYSTNFGASWIKSPLQSQHPVDASYSFIEDIDLPDSQIIVFYAMDNGGNVPEFCEMIYIDVHRDNPAASIASPFIKDGLFQWHVESEHQTAHYEIERRGNGAAWTLVATDSSGAGRHVVPLPASPETPHRLMEVERSGRRIAQGYAASVAGAPLRRPSLPPDPPRIMGLPAPALARAPQQNATLGSRDFHRDLLIITVDDFVPAVQELEQYWESGGLHSIDVLSLGPKTQTDVDSRRQLVRSLIVLYSMSRTTKRFLLVGDANDWQEFDGPKTSQYWVGSWEGIRQDLLAAGYPAGGQPALNIIPTFAVADTAPRGSNMAYVAPYFLTDQPYVENLDAVITRWPASSEEEVLALALKVQEYDSRLPSPGLSSAICYVGDLDFDDPGDGQLAWQFAQNAKVMLSSRHLVHEFNRSNWTIPAWLIGEAAALWNSAVDLRIVAVMGSLSTRYRPADILNKEEMSFPFDVPALLTTSQTPFVVGSSCGTADFARTERLEAQPLEPTPICEDFLFAAGKGAIAWIGPTCGTWQSGNEAIALLLIEELLEDPERAMALSWGEALRRVGVEYPPTHPVHQTAASYVYLGDPFTAYEPPGPVHAKRLPSAQPPFALGPCSPNPFETATRIQFTMPERAPIEISIFDIAGRKVRRLLCETVEAGEHEVEWTGEDDRQEHAAPGIYFFSARSRGRELTRKMVKRS